MASIDSYKKIIADLERLAHSGAFTFGSQAHRFRLHPPMSDDELHAFEHKYGVHLPEDYRMFLTHVGRGGGGPCYGLFDFHEMDDGFEYKTWSQGDGFVGVLANPFPYTDHWNDLTGQPDDDLVERDEQEYERQLTEFEQRYWAQLDGAVPICGSSKKSVGRF